jgi:hypothetical protein
MSTANSLSTNILGDAVSSGFGSKSPVSRVAEMPQASNFTCTVSALIGTYKIKSSVAYLDFVQIAPLAVV